MSMRYLGGVISSTAVVPTTASAPGVWTLEQAQYYLSQNSWPVTDLHWIAGMVPAGGSLTSWGLDTDTYGNVYVTGGMAQAGAGYQGLFIAKFNQGGVLQWIKEIASSSFGNIVKVSGGNLIVFGTYYDPSNGVGLKTTCSVNGVISAKKGLPSSGNSIYLNYSAIDSSSNVYAGGEYVEGSYASYGLYTVKYDSSGTIVWQKLLYNVSSSKDVAVDSNGNVYNVGNSSAGMAFIKYNSSGSLQWQKAITNNTYPSNHASTGLAIDSSDNVYVSGSVQAIVGGSPYLLFISKFNSAGTLQWQRMIDSVSANWSKITIDTSNNIYVTGANFIAKYNSSGVIQWQRSLTNASYMGAIKWQNNSIYISGSNTGLVAKLADNGSGTGTYTANGVSYTYAVSTNTEIAGYLTVSTTSYTDSSLSLTETTPTLYELTPTVAAGTAIVN